MVGYRLVVSRLDSVGASGSSKIYFVPYKWQIIDGVDIPDQIEFDQSTWPQILAPHKRFLVALNDDLTRITDFIQGYQDHEWLHDAIDETNKYNKSLTVQGVGRGAIAPKPDDLFMDPKTWEFLVTTVDLDMYPIMMGPTGCGKTKAAKTVAKALNFDYYGINCGALFKPKSTLIGTVQAVDGSTHLFESEFLKFFSSDKPTLIYLDEISRIPSAAANMLMPVLDREQNYLYVEEKSERIYKGKQVHFIAAANFGMQYVDARKLDDAFMNRFIPFYMDYLKQKEEEALINMNVPGLRKSEVEKLVQVANKLRANRESLGQEVSHRHMIDAARFLSRRFTLQEVMDHFILNLFINGNDDRRQAADQIIKSIL